MGRHRGHALQTRLLRCSSIRRRPDSARFNPLFEIRKGDNEMRDTQNIVEMLVNPTGAKHTMDIWDQQASQFLVALILHVLYTEPDQYKNLATVRARLLDFKQTAKAMIRTPHRFNPQTGAPEVHPEVALGGQTNCAASRRSSRPACAARRRLSRRFGRTTSSPATPRPAIFGSAIWSARTGP